MPMSRTRRASAGGQEGRPSLASASAEDSASNTANACNAGTAAAAGVRGGDGPPKKRRGRRSPVAKASAAAARSGRSAQASTSGPRRGMSKATTKGKTARQLPMRSTPRLRQSGGRKSYSEKEDDAAFERMLAGADSSADNDDGSGSSGGSGCDDEDTNGDGSDNGEEEEEEEDEDENKKDPAAKFVCGLCSKSFKAKLGLDYHVKNQVCQRKKAKTGNDDASLQKKKKRAKARSRGVSKAIGGGETMKRVASKSKARGGTGTSIGHGDDDNVDEDDPTGAKESPFCCPKCSRSFKQQHGLEYHVKHNVCQDGNIKTPPKHSRGGKGGKFGPIDMRTCPYCKKVFSIVSGLAYHLEHKVCQRSSATTGGGGGSASARKRGGAGGVQKKKGPRAKVTKEERSLAGSAPFPPLQPGQKFVTRYGIVEVVADDRIPKDYGTTKIGGYDAAKVPGGVDEAKLVQLGKDCQRYKRSKEREKDREERLWAQSVRSNLRKRRRLGRHYAQEVGLETKGSTGFSAGGRPLSTQMVVWQECVSTKTLTPDNILNYGATYKPPRDEGDVMDITFNAKGGIKQEEGVAHPAPAKVPQVKIDDPLVPADSYPDRIVTCQLVTDRRQRIYDYSARLSSPAASTSGNNEGGNTSGGKSMESAWDIVLKAKKEAERAKKDETEVKNGNRGRNKAAAKVGKRNDSGGLKKAGEEEKKEEEKKEENPKQNEKGRETDGRAVAPIITKLCLRRCLLTEPYHATVPVFICRDCGKVLKSREGLREHVLVRICQPPEPETDDSSVEEEEAATEEAREPATAKTTSGGITLRARRKRKQNTYVEISSDDEEGGLCGGKTNRNKKKCKRKKADDDDDDEWDAAADDAKAQDNDDDDDVVSMVSEKEDDRPTVVGVPDDDADMLVVDAIPSISPKRGKKQSTGRASLASITCGISRGRGRRGGNIRLAALADFDPDDDSSVEIMSIISRSHKTPVKDRFGVDPDRRLSRKEWKRLKRPGWMQFKPEASSWYPEIMKCLGIKRGSNNQNWKRLKMERKRFEPVKNVRKERKAKQRLGDGPVYPSVMAKLDIWEGISNKTMYPNVFEYLGFDKPRNAPRIRSMRRRSVPSLELLGDEDKNYERRDQQAKRLERERERAEVDVTSEECPKSTRRKRATKRAPRDDAKVSTTGSRKRKKRANPPPTVLPNGGNDVTSKNFTINSFKVAGGPMIDLNVLVEEVDVGRFPSMKRYEEDDHIDVCELCHETSDYGDRGVVYCCAFCPNAEHFPCLKSRYNVHEWDEDDDFMCHSCLATCLHRRHRAERRRLGQVNERKSKKKKTSIVGGDKSSQDDGAWAVVGSDDGNDISADGDDDDQHQQPTLEMPSLPMAASGPPQKSEIDFGNTNHLMPVPACPSGGPGGLICCLHCASSYSRVLSSTTKEMETQMVWKVGQEVGELMEMLQDAQARMRLALDVSKENDVRSRRRAT